MPRIGGGMQGDEPHREFRLATGSLAVVGVNGFLPRFMKNYPRVFATPKRIVALCKVGSPIVNIFDWNVNRPRNPIGHHSPTDSCPISQRTAT